MKIYVVLLAYVPETQAIFSTEQDAQKYIDKQDEHDGIYYIQTWTLRRGRYYPEPRLPKE